jgi:DNA-binding SARP family transcriptional activator
MGSVEFRILGPLEVWQDGRALALRGARQRALLAMLLLHAGEVVSTERLVDAIWGEEPPDAGVTALRVRVSQLRKALGADAEVLVTRPPGYAIHVAAEQFDLPRFERLTTSAERAMAQGAPAEAVESLQAALALWRGPPLEDLAYEPFAQAPIMRLEELRLAALELRMDAELALGRHARLAGELRALAAEHPLRERLHGQLMLALYRDGRQAEALEIHRGIRRRLVDEIGLEPGPALRELEQRLLAQDPGLDPAPRPAPVRPAATRVVLVHAGVEAAAVCALIEPLATQDATELIVTAMPREAAELDAAAAWLEHIRAAAESHGAVARVAAFTSPAPGRDVTRFAAEQDATLLVLQADPALLEDGRPPAETAVPLRDAPCDVALVAGAARQVAAPDGPVLVPFAGGEHDWAALELGAWLARARGAGLRLAGSQGNAGGRDASRALAHASLALQRSLGVVAQPLLVEPGADALAAAAGEARVVVVGLSDRWAREGLGPVRMALANRAPTAVMLVRRGVRPGGLAPPSALTRFTWSAG